MKTIGIVAIPRVQLLDVSGPLDVFAQANRYTPSPVYRPCVVGTQGGAIVSSSGVRILADIDLETALPHPFDTLLIAGAPHAAEYCPPVRVTQWLHRILPATRRYGSICSGAFVLGHSGFLTGKRVTTHWAVADALQQMFPETIVEADAFYSHDGPLRTAAGVTAGLDLALSLVEEDLGREIALKVASDLVMLFKRSGGQTPFSRQGTPSVQGRSALQTLQRWIMTAPEQTHTLETLANRVSLSPRHLSRLFTQEVGLPLSVWVEDVRLTKAKDLLSTGLYTPKQVATLCGFPRTETFRRAFERRLGITPTQYRKHYGG